MRPHVLAAAAIAALACTRQEPAPQQPAPGPQAAASGLKEYTGPRPTPAPAALEIVIDDKALDAYLAFKGQVTAETRKAIADLGAHVAMRAGSDALRNAAQTGAESEAMAQRLEARRAALLGEHGLSEAQVRKIEDLVLSTLAARSVAGEGDGGFASVAQMRQQIASLPADQRARGEAEVAKMEKGLSEMVNAKEARARFGDAAVELVLRREPELSALQQDGVGLLAQ